jgi:hypothetical protein
MPRRPSTGVVGSCLPARYVATLGIYRGWLEVEADAVQAERSGDLEALAAHEGTCVGWLGNLRTQACTDLPGGESHSQFR